MAFLADLGRAAPAIERAMTDIEERPRRALRWGWEQEQAGQTKAVNEMTLNRMKAEEVTRKEKEEYLKKPWNARFDLMFSNLPKEHTDKAIKTMQQTGILDEKEMGTMNGREIAVQMIKEKPDIFKWVTDGMELNLKENAQKTYDDVVKLQNTPGTDQEKLKKAIANAKAAASALELHQKGSSDYLDALDTDIKLKEAQNSDAFKSLPDQQKNRINVLVNIAKSIDDYKNILAEIGKVLEEAKQITPNWKVVQDPKSKTLYSYQDLNNPTAPLMPGAPAPKAAAEVNIDVGGKSFTEIGKKMGEKVVEEQKDAQLAYTSLENLQEAKKLLSSGMITGTGAGYILNTGKALQQAGINLAPDFISNTEAYAALMGKQVGQIIKQFGSGAGLSDADREYAEKIAGGKITLTKQSLEKIISINEKGLKNIVNNYNKRAKEVMSKPESKDLPYNLIINTDPQLMEETERWESSPGGKQFDIPKVVVDEFKKDWPKARRIK